MQFQQGWPSRSCRHSFMFRLPCLLGPPIAPTAVALCLQGSRAVYSTQWTWSYPQELWYRYVPESGNWHDGTFTRWIAALSAASWSDVCLTSTSRTETGINMAVRTTQSIVPTTNLNVIKFSRKSFVSIFQITVLSPYLNTES